MIVGTDPGLTQNDHPIRQTYFMSGEIILHIRHDPGMKGNILEKWVEGELWNNGWMKENETTRQYKPSSIKHIHQLTGSDTSLVKVTINELKENDDDFVDRNGNLKDKPGAKSNSLVEIINVLNAHSAGGGTSPVATAQVVSGPELQAVSPNWLFSTAPHTIGHPGPGGWPVFVALSDLQVGKQEFDTAAIQTIIDQCPKGKSPGRVDVVIFDTAPNRHPHREHDEHDPAHPAPRTVSTSAQDDQAAQDALDNVHQKYDDFGRPGHPTLKQQFQHIVYADRLNPPFTLPPIPPENDREHYTTKDYYDLSDHGTFIAGIIHSIAPDATIHLVEVMNAYGIGTLESIIRGVVALLEGDKDLPKPESGRKLVLNFSLGLGLPPENEEKTTLPNSYTPANGTPQPWDVVIDYLQSKCLSLVDATFADLELAFSLLEGDVVIVAAAGNDGQKDENDAAVVPPPPPLYPAAFPDVVSVAALDDDDEHAWYSNLSQAAPNYGGVAVTGGNMILSNYNADPAIPGDHDQRWNTSSKGILGVHIREFPKWTQKHDDVRSENPTDGWARWSGTSFATGVMSGIFAWAAQEGCTISIKDQTVDHFYKVLQAQPLPRTAYNELKVSPTQG
jgi:hypothetical protein